MNSVTYTVYDDSQNQKLLYEYIAPSRVIPTMAGVRIDGRDWRVNRSQVYLGHEIVLWVRP